MIEAYAFLVAFAAQILVASVLFPSRLINYTRGWANRFGSERFAQLYPGVDYSRWVERFVTGYRAVTITIALFGVLLLGWLSTLIRHPNWVQEVTIPTLFYFFAQFSPLIVISLWAIVRHRKVLSQMSQETKRKATLQRRGLFDFVSPFAVLVGIVSYILFVWYAIWLDVHVYQNSSLSKPCLIAIGSVTLTYALNALIIYKFLYGRRNSLVTNEGRAHTIGARVKGGVYGSIVVAWFAALIGMLSQPGLQDWRPFALSTYFVIMALLGLMDVSAPRKPEVGALGESPAS